MDSDEGSASVLVVEDEDRLADLYGEWLASRYHVEVAKSGEEALRQYDEGIDIVLLDRQMPGLSGDGVVEAIRRSPHECKIAMVTGVEPDVDIVDMGIDEYLVKPVDKSDLIDLVQRLCRRRTYDELLNELYALASKKGALEAHNSRTELRASSEYGELRHRLDDLHERIDDTVAEFDNDDFVGFLREADATVP